MGNLQEAARAVKKAQTSIWLRLVSSVTSDGVTKQCIVESVKEWDPDAAMEFIEDAVREAISEYFGRETDPNKRIEKYAGLIGEIRSAASMLKRRRRPK